MEKLLPNKTMIGISVDNNTETDAFMDVVYGAVESLLTAIEAKPADEFKQYGMDKVPEFELTYRLARCNHEFVLGTPMGHLAVQCSKCHEIYGVTKNG